MKEPRSSWWVIMEPGLKKRKERLYWIVKFIQTDLDNLSAGERNRYNRAFMPLYAATITRALHDAKGAAIHLFPPEGLKEIQIELREFFNRLLEQQKNGFPISLPPSPKELVITPSGEYQIEYPIYIAPEKIADVSPLISEFADLLSGTPKDSIKKCPHCGQFFIHVSLKPKIYHSTKCANAAIYQKRIEQLKREGKYENYLNGQKKKMRTYYKKMSKKRGGGLKRIS